MMTEDKALCVVRLAGQTEESNRWIALSELQTRTESLKPVQ